MQSLCHGSGMTLLIALWMELDRYYSFKFNYPGYMGLYYMILYWLCTLLPNSESTSCGDVAGLTLTTFDGSPTSRADVGSRALRAACAFWLCILDRIEVSLTPLNVMLTAGILLPFNFLA